jgi:hypothetical protein
MRRTTTILCVLGLIALGFGGWLGSGPEQTPVTRIVSNSSSGTVIDVELPGVSVDRTEAGGTTYDIIGIPGENLAALDVGRPQVPKLSYLLGIPEHARVAVQVTVLETRTFDNINCYPYQPPQLDNQTSTPFVIDREFYSQDKNYPGLDAQVMNTGVWRELAVGNIQVYPVHYNPVTRQLLVYTRMRANISYSGGVYPRKVIPGWLASTYARWIDNFGSLDIEVSGADNPGVKYLVIAHDNWASNSFLVDSLIGWHYKRGIETRLVHKPSWPVQEVKDSIAAEYGRSTPAELRWVLLVGEASEIPQHALGGVGAGDYWYSDLLPSGSTDNYPEIGLSRLSPGSAGDLENEIRKILLYEKNPPSTGNWLSKHALIACSELYPGKYSACVRGIYNEPMGWWRYNFDTLMCQFHGNDSIARIINEGRSVVTYRGHGDVDQWYTLANAGGAPWYIADVNALTNGNLTPMVFNIACLCGEISAATCLSEAWMRKYPGGAVGSFAATQASYTLPNHGICSTLVRSMCDTWTITVPGVRNYTMPVWDIGWIQCNVDAYVAKYWPASPYPDNIYMYLNLGDPAMDVWAGGQPVAASVTYQPAIPIGPYSLPVSVQAVGQPVKGALVCAWKGAEFWVTGKTDDAGQVTLDINSTSPGTFYVTVSGGHALASPPVPILPFEGTCLARTANSPYVVHIRHSIDDAPPGGNGDGIVNPGETVNMPTWVKNLGNQSGTGVTGKLRTSDPAVTVTDSFKTFGTIPANESAYTGSDGYKFHVGDTCTNGHNIGFSLVCKDANDSTWTSTFSVRVGTGILGYDHKRVEDPPPGGNGNGKIDPGEDGLLYVFLRNTGGGIAYNTRAILRSGDTRFTITDSIGTWATIPRDTALENGGDPFGVHADGSITPETPIPCTLYVTADGFSGVASFATVIGEITTFDPIPDNATPTPIYWAYDNVDVGYTEHPTYNWIEINTQGTRLTLSDDQTVQLTLPTAFGPWKYYNQRYTGISVCGNGFVMPGSYTATGWTNYALPTSNLAAPAVCAAWDDLYPPTGGGVWYFHDAVNHVFVVEWDSVAYYSPRTTFDKFEILIFDTTLASARGMNEVVVQYRTAYGYSSMTAGIQNETYTYGINCVTDNSYTRGVATILAGSAIKYTSDVPVTGILERPESLNRLLDLRLAVYPNPFFGRAAIRCQIPVAGDVSLKVFDASGRMVSTLYQGKLAPGSYTFRWNGTDGFGRDVAAGVYFYELETATTKLSTKATLLR